MIAPDESRRRCNSGAALAALPELFGTSPRLHLLWGQAARHAWRSLIAFDPPPPLLLSSDSRSS